MAVEKRKNKDFSYGPLILFVVSMIVFGCVGYYMLSMNANSGQELRESCEIMCRNNNMTYEGVKDGLCACNPSIGVRIYLEPYIKSIVDGKTPEEMQEMAGNPPFVNVTVNSSLGSAAKLRFSPEFYEKYQELS